MNSYFDLRDDQKSIVSELTSGVPLQSTRCIQFNRIIIFYKWSSENRFFSTNPSLRGKDAIMGCFNKLLIIKMLYF